MEDFFQILCSSQNVQTLIAQCVCGFSIGIVDRFVFANYDKSAS